MIKLRREVRLRKEYLYRKAQEDRLRSIEEKKQRVKSALDENRLLPTEVRKEALQLQKLLEFDDDGGEGVSSHIDDEYKWAGVEDPKILVTTSRDPSSRLKMFAKEVKLMFPGAQRMNRGNHEVSMLVHACKANDVTDLVIVHETRGQPDGLVVCHLPFGPTAYFTLYNVVMRHDVPDIGTMSEAFPHLVFHNFTSRLGRRVCSILKYLFPVPKEDSKRVITFANKDDFISFRHHTYKKTDHKNIELTEVGPRFEMKCNVYDQIGHPGEREHCGRGVASPCVHAYCQEAEVPECGVDMSCCGHGEMNIKDMRRNTGVCDFKVLEAHMTLHSKNSARNFCTSSTIRNCWSCGSSRKLFFCSSCKVIQPPIENVSYFELFNCDQTFALDTQKLQQRYLELQKSLHPDNFSLKSLTEQGYSELQSALVNKAYSTLQKPVTRAVYMLQLQGVHLEEGTDSMVSHAFLLEVMKVNEKLWETQSREEVASIGQSVRGDLQSAKELLARMKYFSNLEEKVKEQLTESL
ncbi:hypothetical protein P4O66_012202 [Electrophorus voltai]|uniref:Brix domain-containing protein n=1 Tax=Electrophorus voltai TaxID=2609070 RepID=A0AAD9DSC7_9TELE|nr:hypothetical protein P4O66_012202 [Electrophorus voltai]